MRGSWLGGACAITFSLSGCHASNKAEAATGEAKAEGPVAAQCGHADLPDCPLQRWMKATLQTYQRTGDYPRLARAFSELAEHAPEGYPKWQAHATKGAELAAKSDADAIKQVCKDCHSTYRSQYKHERRSAPLW